MEHQSIAKFIDNDGTLASNLVSQQLTRQFIEHIMLNGSFNGACAHIRIIAFPDFTMQARFCGHAWVGWTPGSGLPETSSGASESSVYVTRYGEVYHTDPECIYLNPQVRAVPASQVSSMRSGDGSRYYPCECCRPGKGGVVYVTKEGNRYIIKA